MKKIVFLAALLCLTGAFVFANDFTVKSVSGRVESAGTALAAGTVINQDAVIRSNVGASLVLADAAGNEFTVRGNGKISDLINASSSTRLNGNNVRTNTDATAVSTRQVSTASARASDQAGLDDIDAE